MPQLVSGRYEPDFLPVVEAFDDHLRSTPYGGASLSVYHGGKPVIDVWGGLADAGAGGAWEEETSAVLFSCSKSVSAIVVLWLAEHGLIDIDAPVAVYWPEFAAHGKVDVTVRELMAHRAGVPLVDAPLTRTDVLADTAFADAMAAQKPLWRPGTAHAYHAVSVGAGLGEIVRRVTGRSLGTVLAEELADPLGLDLWIGVPERELSRIATVLPPDPTRVSAEMAAMIRAMLAEDDRAWRTLTVNGTLSIPLAGVSLENAYNDPDVRAAELPAANGVGTARSLAKLHAALVGPVDDRGVGASRLLSEETLTAATKPMSQGAPAFGPPADSYPAWGSGFMVPWEQRPMLTEASFGHDGAAGGLCFADPRHQVGFTFLPSVMGSAAPDTRVNTVVHELRRCLGVQDGD
ncbi:serine hydrolase domain-containing protein [Nocardioides sp. NPDC058538]|uniref:serine hydrolase domain-containing protein n=1 Tax=Nocardioides sp. NPDC058538 TaxID=3346542 RepID=UPI00365BCB85